MSDLDRYCNRIRSRRQVASADSGSRYTLPVRAPYRRSFVRSLAPDLRLVVAVALVALGAAPTVSIGAAELPYLVELPVGRVAVRYTPGSLDRASRVKDRFELLVAEIVGSSDLPLGLAINLLSRDEWEKASIGVPYGLPATVGPNELALAAWGDAGTVALWHRLAPNGVPRLNGMPVRGTRAEAESLSALDLVAQVEAVRILLPAFSPAVEEPWWEPLCSHAFAWSAFMRYESARLPEIVQFFGALATGQPTEVDRTGGVAERVRSDARFVQAAALVGAAEKKPPAKPLMKWFRKKGAVDTAARLIDRYPELAEWLRRVG